MMVAGKTDHIWSMGELLTFPYFKTSVNQRVDIYFTLLFEMDTISSWIIDIDINN